MMLNIQNQSPCIIVIYLLLQKTVSQIEKTVFLIVNRTVSNLHDEKSAIEKSVVKIAFF
jgi:hypothetical protein